MKVTAQNFNACFKQVNAAYIARCEAKNEIPNINPKTGFNPDIDNAMKTVSQITPAQWDVITALDLGDEFMQALKKTVLKPAKRIIQVLAVLGGADASKHLQMSAKTLFLAVGAYCVASCKSRDGLAFAVTGKGNLHTSDGINVEVARKMLKHGAISPASLATTLSVCFASGAMGELLHVGKSGGKNENPVIDANSVVTRAIVQRIASMTEIEVQHVTGNVAQ